MTLSSSSSSSSSTSSHLKLNIMVSAGKVFLLLLLLLLPPVALSMDSVECLRGVKDAFPTLPWTFPAASKPGFVCEFDGISCWNIRENRVVEIHLKSRSLSGTLPSALRFCADTTTLDLAGNSLSGPIPPELCSWMPYLVTLDLSSNAFDGAIPANLSSCKFLNKLLLNNNQLSGEIPGALVQLNRLHDVSFAGNGLSGMVPEGLAKFGAKAFEGNKELCGRPLGKCGGLSQTSLIVIVFAGVFGALASVGLAYGVWRWCFAKPVATPGVSWLGGVEEGEAQWVGKLRRHHLVQVNMFHKPIVRVRLAHLLAATNGFDPINIVSTSRTGTAYKAVLPDGSVLAVKRLHGCHLSEKNFISEVEWLGKLRHPNLVPLLGFVIIEDEHLLIYKDMQNGTLSSSLQAPHLLDWRARLKVGIGAVRGLAWLHHGVQPHVIHQNLCSSNILMDDDHDARITDFGLAKMVSRLGSGNKLTTFRDGDFGERGYVAPEYSTTMMPSLKGDVYALGVVLLQLVTGKKPLDVIDGGEGFKGSLVEWINYLSNTFRLGDAVDQCLLGKGYDDDVMHFLRIAAGCVSPRPKDRSSMYQVYESLKALGETHDYTEQDDEFPFLFGKDEKGLH